MIRLPTAPTAPTVVAAGAVMLQAVSSDATTIAAASPSGTRRAPLGRDPAARSTARPQPAPIAASTMDLTNKRAPQNGALLHASGAILFR